MVITPFPHYTTTMSLPVTFVTTVEQREQLEFNERRLKDFEDAIKRVLRETGESDLDKLIRNFIQSKSLLNITVAVKVVLFKKNQQLKYLVMYFHQWRNRTTLY